MMQLTARQYLGTLIRSLLLTARQSLGTMNEHTPPWQSQKQLNLAGIRLGRAMLPVCFVWLLVSIQGWY